MRYEVREDERVKCICHRFVVWDTKLDRQATDTGYFEDDAVMECFKLNLSHPPD